MAAINNPSILIIDDEPDILKVLGDILTQEGYRIKAASGSKEALELFRPESFDLVITDIRMPGMGGIELMRQIKKLDETVEVIILTGFADMESAIQALNVGGAFDYLSKPLDDIERLVNTIHQALGKRKLLLDNKKKTAELIRTNDELKASEQRYHKLIDKMINGFALHEIICDENGKAVDYRFLEVNHAFEQMTGLSAADVVEKSVRQVLPELEPSWINTYGRVALTGESVRFEDYARQLGKYFEVLAYCPEKGRFATVFTDITGRRDAEDNLKIAEREKTAILNSMLDTLVYMDMEYKIIWTNRATGESTGLSAEQMAGRYCYDVFCQEKETCQECPVTKSYKSRMVEKSVIDGPDGKVLSMRCYPVQDETGNTIGVVVLSQDITEKRMMESELSKARKLESIGILSGGIAHDYNNLLSVIMGNISLAKLNLKPYDESNKYLDDAEKASKAAKDLSNKLITFSRGGAPNKRETSIAPLLENTVGLALSGSNIQSNFFMADALPTVEIDESQIGQVFHNLVVNAREAMHEGGILRVGAETVRLDEKNILDLNSGEYLKIWIEDSGAGIPEKEMDRIFDPYFSTKQRGAQKGMGMGLTICYSIIKNHGGVISVKSPEGTGTTVTIHLPTIIAGQKESVSEHDHPKIQASVGHGLSFNPKVLVMDDEKMVLDIIGKILVRFNYTVEFSTNGADTVDMYKKAFTSGEPFDAVILDLTIRNGIGGRKTLEELIKIDPHVKGIVSSGYSDDPVITDFKAYGFRAALAKPYNMQQLSETMEKILREEE